MGNAKENRASNIPDQYLKDISAGEAFVNAGHRVSLEEIGKDPEKKYFHLGVANALADKRKVLTAAEIYGKLGKLNTPEAHSHLTTGLNKVKEMFGIRATTRNELDEIVESYGGKPTEKWYVSKNSALAKAYYEMVSMFGGRLIIFVFCLASLIIFSFSSMKSTGFVIGGNSVSIISGVLALVFILFLLLGLRITKKIKRKR